VATALLVAGSTPTSVSIHQLEIALERATSHIKVTCPLCLFRLPPWKM